MKSFIATVCFGIVIAASLPHQTSADQIDKPPSGKAFYMVLADEVGAQYGIPSSEIKNVVQHESGYDPEAVGDHGLARGTCQYHQSTFDHYENLYFMATGNHLSYDSSADQITLMAWQWKNYPQSRSEWSTWRKLYGKAP